MKHLLAISLVLAAAACGGKSTPAPTPPPGDDTGAAGGGAAGGTRPADCVKGGCSGTMCVEHGNDVVTTCEWKPEYACYQQAECTRQADGTCGWTQSAELTACLANPPAQ